VADEASIPQPASAGDRDVLHGLLHRASYTERDVVSRLGGASLANVGDVAFLEHRRHLEPEDDPLALLVRWFIFGEPIPRTIAESRLTRGEIDMLLRAGLLSEEGVAGHEPAFLAPVMLVPVDAPALGVGEVWVASDRHLDASGTPLPTAPDFVFSGHNGLTRQFLGLLPPEPGRRVLDLCAGTAVAAMLLARHADRAVAIDLTSRATAFAQFNLWLNDASRVDLKQGDLFQPVASERFDCICAHPPYVPTFHETAVYRDGGELGERVVRRLIEAVPRHLEVGGTFHLLCLGMDTAEGTFEERARRWMGPEGRAFDVVFGFDHAKSGEQFARYIIARTTDPAHGELDRWMELFARHRVTQVVYGALVGRRLERTREGQVRRVKLDDATRFESFRWWFDWQDWLREPDRRGRLFAAVPRLATGTKLLVESVVKDTDFQPTLFRLTNGGWPFPTQVETDGWVVGFLATLLGDGSLQAKWDDAKRAGRTPSACQDADIEKLIAHMLERGILELPDMHGLWRGDARARRASDGSA
jgi:SAM-dependent methyltransferase